MIQHGQPASRDDQRRYDIDWLRVLATYLLFVFHVSKVFDVAPFYHVKNAELSPNLDLLTFFIHFWHMPLFFVLAGWSAHASIRRRGGAAFVHERLRRLLLPLVAGTALFGPVLKYYELRSGFTLDIFGYRQLDAAFEEPFLTFLPTFYSDFTRFTWSHLWFLAYLFTFSMLYRPLLVRWLDGGERFAPQLPAGDSAASASPARRLWAPLVVLCAIQVTLRLVWPGGQNLINDWANFAYYSTFFLLGFVLARHPAWQLEIDRQWKTAATMAVISYAAMYGYWRATDGNPWPQQPSLSAILALLPVLALTAVAGYAMVVLLLGAGHRLLQRGGAALDYLAESSMPVYILHQVGVTVTAFYIVHSSLGFGAKYALTLLASIVATMAAYHFVVRCNPYLRPLFGMRPARLVPLDAPSRRGAAAAAMVTAGALLLAAFSAAAAVAPQRSDLDPIGIWYADGGAARVEIRRCGEQLCGRIVSLQHPYDDSGCPLRDAHNPDASARKRPVEGLDIVGGLKPSDEPGVWSGGWIYDPGSGRTYSCTLSQLSPERLDLRGYLGISLLGRTTTWWRVGSEAQRCELPSS
ncbi:MAG: DUF2147 domain-containing protein [Deltaproteobacteria bacterium]|nr:DUF2147 domain-containing protein [Deltaproteobacteria bacterium]